MLTRLLTLRSVYSKRSKDQVCGWLCSGPWGCIMECHRLAAAAQPRSAMVGHSSDKVRGVLNEQSPDTNGGVHVNNDDLDVDRVTKETSSGSRAKRRLTHSTTTLVECTLTRMTSTLVQQPGSRVMSMSTPCLSRSRESYRHAQEQHR